MSDYRFGLLLVFASAIAWSTAGVFTRLLTLDAWTILAWRGVFGALSLAVLICVLNGRRTLSMFARMGAPGWAFAVLSAAGMVFFITSLRHTTVAHNSVIYATIPLMAAALAWFVLGERPSRSAIVASVTALAGVGLMVGLGAEGGLFGDLLALAMTMSVAGMVLITRKWRDIPVMPAACISGLLSAAVSWPLGAPLDVSGQDLALLAAFGVINSGLGLALFTLGARHLPAIETALIGALDAPLAPLWVWILFSETPSLATLTGGLIVLIAVGCHMALTARPKAAAPTPPIA